MKKILLVLLFTFSLNANNFRLGINTENYQDSEGGSISISYKYKDNILFETSYHEFYIRGIKNNTTVESWNKFNTQRLGVRYYLKSYSNNEIKLFTSIGVEHIFKNNDLTTNTPSLNSYGLMGLDFTVNNNFNITFAFGSSGKGDNANNLKGNLNYAHGFNSIIGIEYNF